MRIMRITAVVIVLLILLCGACGIMDIGARSSDAPIEKMVGYMNDKYSDTFTYVRTYGGHFGSTTHKIMVASDQLPGKEISVILSEGGDAAVLSDNYVAVKYEEETRSLIHGILSDCFGEKLFVGYSANNLATSSVFNDDTAFQDYIKEPSSAIYFTAIIRCPSDSARRADMVSSLEQKLVSAGLCCGGKLFFCSDFDDFDSLTNENYYEKYLSAGTYDASLYINMTSSLALDKAEWSEGNG